MKIGDFNERISFTEFVRTPDSAGGSTAVTSVVFETWAKVETVNGTRTVSAGEQVLEDGVIIHIRKNAERVIDKTDRIIWRGDNYQIQSIVPRKDGRSGKVLWVYEIIAKKQADGKTELSPLVLLDNNGDVLTDNNGNALLG